MDLIFENHILFVPRTVKRSRKTVSNTCPWSDGVGGFPSFYSFREIGQKTNILSRPNLKNCLNIKTQ